MNLAVNGASTAVRGVDYNLSTVAIVIPAGQTSGSATLTAIPDSLPEIGETVVLDVSTVVNGVESGIQQVTVTIQETPAADPLRGIFTQIGGAGATGSTGNTGVSTSGAAGNRIAGGVQDLLAHPTNANILYAAAVNGGVWKTTNATATNPHWVPTSDRVQVVDATGFPVDSDGDGVPDVLPEGLSIGSIAFDLKDTVDSTPFSRLIAGTGLWSSASDVNGTSNPTGQPYGGYAGRILISENGGDSWVSPPAVGLEGQNIISVVMEENRIVVATSEATGEPIGTQGGGLFYSSDGGATFSRVTTFGTNGTTDLRALVADPTAKSAVPGVPGRLYAASVGTNSGIWRSDDFGITWTAIDNSLGALSGLLTSSDVTHAVEMVVHPVTGRLYVAVMQNSQFSGLFWAQNADENAPTWNQMDTPIVPNRTVTITGVQNSPDTTLTPPQTAPQNPPAGAGPIRITSANHGLANGDVVIIRNASNGALNGRFVIGAGVLNRLDANTLTLNRELDATINGTSGNDPLAAASTGGEILRIGVLNGTASITEAQPQGSIHFSLNTDTENANIVYVGLNRLGVSNALGTTGNASLWRGDASANRMNTANTPQTYNPTATVNLQTTSPQWDSLAGPQNTEDPGSGTAGNTRPHVGSRDIAIDANGTLLQSDDAGIFRRTTPRNNTGDWQSMAGDLNIFEYENIGYDTLSNQLIVTSVDNGIHEGSVPALTDPPDAVVPNAFTVRGPGVDVGALGIPFGPLPGIGAGVSGDVQVGYLRNAGGTVTGSVRYASGPYLAGLTVLTYNPAGVLTGSTTANLNVTTGAAIGRQHVTPIAVNALDGRQIILGASNGIYESFNSGATVDNVSQASGTVAATPNAAGPLAYGGRSSEAYGDNPFVIFAGANGRVWVRTQSAGKFASFNLPTTEPVLDVEINPNEWTEAFVTTRSRVFRIKVNSNDPVGQPPTLDPSVGAGTGIEEITHNLTALLAPPTSLTPSPTNYNAADIFSLEYIDGSGKGVEGLVVGTSKGVFATTIYDLVTAPAVGGGTVRNQSWFAYGTALPEVAVRDMDYDAQDDVLVLATLGRGAWKLDKASEFLTPKVSLDVDVDTIFENPVDGTTTAVVTATLTRPNFHADVMIRLGSSGDAEFTEPGETAGTGVLADDYLRDTADPTDAIIIIPAGMLTGTATITAVQDLHDEIDELIQITGFVANSPEGEIAQSIATQTYTSSTAVPITEDGLPTPSRLTITDTGLITDLDLTLNITHTEVANLSATLRKVQFNTTTSMWETVPGTSVVNLFSTLPANNANLANTIFDDEAATNITTGLAPFSGRFQVETGSLSQLDGVELQGTWELSITDNVSDTVDTGTLNSWSLTVNRATDPTELPQITIIDGNEIPNVSLTVNSGATSQTIAENPEGTAFIRVTLDAVSEKDVVVTLDIAPLLTGKESDFVTTPPADTVPVGSTTRTITIPAGASFAEMEFKAKDDTIDEFDEDFNIDIVGVVNAAEDLTGGEQQVVVTIVDDDAPPEVSLSVSQTSIDEATASATRSTVITVSLPTGITSEKPVTVTLLVDPATTAEVEDYSGLPTSIIIPVGMNSATVTVTAVDDPRDEDNETLIINLGLITNGVANASADTRTVTIVDDDAAPTVTLSVAPNSIAEGSTATITATLSEVSEKTVSVDVAANLGLGTAEATDFTLSAATITFTPWTSSTATGTSVGTVVLTAIDDTIAELSEDVVVEVTSTTNATEATPQTATVTITDTDADPTVTLIFDTGDPGTITENAGGPTSTRVTALLSGPTEKPVTINLGVDAAKTTAQAGPGKDYVLSSFVITIPASTPTTTNLKGTITVTAEPDAVDEFQEQVTLDILSVVNGTEFVGGAVTEQEITVLIDDDNPTPTVSLSLDRVGIRETPTEFATVTATLDGGVLSEKPITVNLLINGSSTATYNTDYITSPAPAGSLVTITIPPLMRSASAIVTSRPDSLEEFDERVILDIDSVVNANENGSQQVTITILEQKPAADEVVGIFVEQGGAAVADGQVQPNVSPDRLVTGAIEDVLAHPTNADIVYVGAVNGGIWKTENATSTNPTWVPLTDGLESLSIGALEFAIDNPNHLVAGTGRFSSFNSVGGLQGRIYLSDDGGTSWSSPIADGLQGENISGVARRFDGVNDVIVVTSSENGGGIFRSTDKGASFAPINSAGFMSDGSVNFFDLVSDPTAPGRLYAAAEDQGIYRSDDFGLNWVKITGIALGTGDNAALHADITDSGNNGLELAVHPATGRLYLGIVTNGQVAGIYITSTGDTASPEWTEMDVPVLAGGINPNPVVQIVDESGSQGRIHFSITADPTDPDIFYIGGERQGNPGLVGGTVTGGSIFRGNASIPRNPLAAPSPQWTHITNNQTTGNTGTHVDSSDMAFDANGNLLEVDGGGIFRRTNPRSNVGDWFSMAGNLGVVEYHSVTYDTISNVIIGGSQDNGTHVQEAPDSNRFVRLNVGGDDGGDVAVDTVTLAGSGQSIRYVSSTNLQNFRSIVFDAANNQVGGVTPRALTTTDGTTVVPQVHTPIAVNQAPASVDFPFGSRAIVVGAANGIYESVNQGNTAHNAGIGIRVTDLVAGPLVYGGRGSTTADDNPYVIYAGDATGSVHVRTESAGTFNETNFSGGAIRDIETDPNQWRTAFAVNATSVQMTTDAGTTWTEITQNLFSVGSGEIFSIQYINGIVNGVNGIVVGTDRGVFAATIQDLNDTSLIPGQPWFRYGSGLPDVQIRDMEYDATDDVLVLGTLGRGAWKLKDASTFLLPNVVLSTDRLQIPEDGTQSVTVTARLSRQNPYNDVIITLGSEGTATFTEAGNGTGTYPDDYTRSTATITIPAGQLLGTATITALPDERDEDDEFLRITGTIATPGEAQMYVRTEESSETLSYLNSTPQAITDNSTITSTVSVSDVGAVKDVNIRLDITHTLTSDLRAVLTGPDGTQVVLFDGVGTGANFVGTVLDDEATTAIGSGANPFTGLFIPAEALSAFDGRPAAGTWTLTIEDQLGSNTGMLNSWSLTIDRLIEPSILPEVTIIDDDALPLVRLFTSHTSIDEDPAAIIGNQATLTVGLFGPPGTVGAGSAIDSGRDVTVTIMITPLPNTVGTGIGSAADFTTTPTAPAGTPILRDVLIMAGDHDATLTFTAVNDLIDEEDERFQFEIVNIDFGTEDGVQSQTVTIVDNDNPPEVSLSVSQNTILEDAAAAPASRSTIVTASLPAGVTSEKDVVVEILVDGASTAEVEDYMGLPTTITIPAGMPSASVTLTAVDDPRDEEDNETVVVKLGSITDGVLSTTLPTMATVNIVDNDLPPTVTLSVDQLTIEENPSLPLTNRQATITATLSELSEKPVTVNIAANLPAGTAEAADFSLAPTSIVIAPWTSTASPGTGQGTALLMALDDFEDEAPETVVVDISGVTNGTELGTQQVTVTIIDEEAPPTVTLHIGTPGTVVGTITEDQGATPTIDVTAKLSTTSQQDVTVVLSIDGSSTAVMGAGNDFTVSTFSIVIPAGLTEGTTTIAALPDAVDEFDETAVIDIETVTNATEFTTGAILEQTVTVNIVDNNPLPKVTLSVDRSGIRETPTETATVTATLDTVSERDVTVNLEINAASTALDGIDYDKSGLVILIPADSLSGSITITAKPDSVVEFDERVIIDVQDGNVTFGMEDGQQQVVIGILEVKPQADEVLGIFVEQGGAAVINGQLQNNVNPQRTVTGAIQDVLTHPTNADIIYVGAINGGIWKTENATAVNPTWVPQTDHLESLSIGAIEFDIADPTYQRLVAGTGRYSGFATDGGDRGRIYLTDDGGTNWVSVAAAGLGTENISGIARRGNDIVVTSSRDEAGAGGGIFRSTDRGASFVAVNGPDFLSNGTTDFYDLVTDPTQPGRLYAAAEDTGIYRSDDFGATWIRITGLALGVGNNAAVHSALTNVQNNDIEMTVSPINGRLYIAVLQANNLAGIFYTTDGFRDVPSPTWTEMDIPVMPISATVNTNPNPDTLSPFQQDNFEGLTSMSLAVDPNNHNVVYFGANPQAGQANLIGDTQFGGRVFRGDATISRNPTASPSPQWDHIVNNALAASPGSGTASNTAPRARSTDMAFDANGNLIEVDKGGIYRRLNPGSNTGDWVSVAGNLGTVEYHSIAYDTISNVIVGGSQGIGTHQQIGEDANIFRMINGGNGGDVAVDTVSRAVQNQSVYYVSDQRLNGFARIIVDASGNEVSRTNPALTSTTTGSTPTWQFYTPIELNAVTPNAMIFGAANGIFETFNSGDSVDLATPSVIATGSTAGPLAYGGRSAVNGDNRFVIYAGDSAGVVHTRLTATATFVPSPSLGSAIRDVEMDPNEWQTAFAVNAESVWMTTDAGANWTDITTNLQTVGAGDIYSIQYINGTANGINGIVVGTDRGAFATTIADLGTWFRYGSGLPDVQIRDMAYDATDDALILGTLGRGSWKLKDASQFLLPNVVLSTDTEFIPEDASLTATITARLSRINPDHDVTITLGSSGTARFTEVPGVPGTGVFADDYTRSITQIVIPKGELFGTTVITAVSDDFDEHDEVLTVEVLDVQNAQSYIRTAASTESRVYNAPGATNITDNGTVTSTINVSDTGVVSDINVSLGVTHPDTSELRATLTAPDGTVVVLFDGPGSGANFTGTTLDDQATGPLVSGANPFAGSFQPLEALSAFAGRAAKGNWILTVTDMSAGNNGAVNGWSLDIERTIEPNILPTITIVDDDDPAQVRLSTSLNTIHEDGSGPGAVATLTVGLYDDVGNMIHSGKDVTVTLDITSLLTGKEADFNTSVIPAGTLRTVTIPAGTQSVNLTFTALNDALDEFAEDFVVDVVSVVNGVEDTAAGEQQQTITIVDDDPEPMVTLTVNGGAKSQTITENPEQTATITATIDAVSEKDVTVTLDITPLLTGKEADFETNPLPGAGTTRTITIPKGLTTATMTFMAKDDALDEFPEDFLVDITEVINGVEDISGGEQQVIITIDDDDPLPNVTLTVNGGAKTQTITENPEETATITATIDAVSEKDVTVTLDITPLLTGKEADFETNPLPGAGLTRTITIPMGMTTATMTFTAKDDALDEFAEDFQIDITGVVNGAEDVAGGPQQVTISIVDDDPLPNVSLTVDGGAKVQTITENPEETATITATIDAVSEKDVIVTLDITPLLTGKEADFETNPLPGAGTTRTITIPKGMTTATMTFMAKDDALDEFAEDFQIDITGVVNGVEDTSGGEQQVVITINDDDPLPNVTLTVNGGAKTQTITENPEQTATITATIDAVSEKDVTVALDITPLLTGREADFETNPLPGAGLTRTITIPKGLTTATMTFMAKNDALDEFAEDFQIDITGVVNGVEDISGGEQQVVITIDDDDPLPLVTLTVDGGNKTQTITENPEETATITATINAVSEKDVTVTLDISPLLTGKEADFETNPPPGAGTTRTITIPKGMTTATMTFMSKDDLLNEFPEDFVVDITGVVNGVEATASGQQQVTITIVDDDPLPNVSLTVDGGAKVQTITENPEETATITATIDAVSEKDVIVTLDITPLLTGKEADFETNPLPGAGTTRTITIPKGMTTATMTFMAKDDALDEFAEDFQIDITGVVNGVEDTSGGEQQVVITINDDDPLPNVTLTVNGGAKTQTITENPEQTATITATIDAVSEKDVTVALDITPLLTGREADFETNPLPGAGLTRTITIPKGLTTATMTFMAKNDALDEFAEDFQIDITGVVNGVEDISGGEQQVVITIDDDDPLPLVTLTVDGGNKTQTITENPEETATITATINAVSEKDVTVTLDISPLLTGKEADFETNPPPGAGTTRTITIPKGMTTATMTFMSKDDLLNEFPEDFVVDITGVVNGVEDTASGQQQVTITIDDDDELPKVSLTVNGGAKSQTITENPEETATITATIDAVSEKDVIVTLDITPLLTGKEADFETNPLPGVGTTRTITIPKGLTTATMTFMAKDDALDEFSEDFQIDIFDVVNGVEDTTSGEQQVTVTIDDDDPLPKVTLSIDREAIRESPYETSVVTATIDAVSEKDVTVNLTVNGVSTATAGTDYVQSSLVIFIPAGQLSGTSTVTTLTDLHQEFDERIVLDIGTAGADDSGAATVNNAVEDGTQRVTITILEIREEGDEIQGVFMEQGGASVADGVLDNTTPDRLVTGAIEDVLAHPTNPDIVYVGAVNGGIWKTENATSTNPTWVPQTDRLESLSIGAIEFDIADPTHQRLVAGTGRYSSFNSLGGPQGRIYISDNGGDLWESTAAVGLQGQNISGIVRAGDVIVVTSSENGGGIFRSTDRGATFLPVNSADFVSDGSINFFDLVSDPTEFGRLYAAAEDTGIYRSDDFGQSWVKITGLTVPGSNNAALQADITDPGNNGLELAVHPNTGRVYLGIVNNGQVAGIYITSDGHTATPAWTEMDVPVLAGGINPNPVVHVVDESGSQGQIHFSITADPTDPDILYIGGERQGNPGLVGGVLTGGSLFRGDAGVTRNAGAAPSPQWTHITNNNTASGTGTHVDSSDLTFAADGSLLQVDGGGIFRRTNPRSDSGDWFTMAGNLGTVEYLSVTYDTISDVIIAGSQDNGTHVQESPDSGRFVRLNLPGEDGADVAVDTVTLAGIDQSIRYVSGTNLAGFRTIIYDSTNAQVGIPTTRLLVETDTTNLVPQVHTPIAINQAPASALFPAGSRAILVGAANGIYESVNQGDTVHLAGPGIRVTDLVAGPLVYGGVSPSGDNPFLIYAGDAVGSVHVRTLSSGLFSATNLGTGEIRDIETDPAEWRTAFAVSPTAVHMTTDAGGTWSDISSNLFRVGAGEIFSIQYINGLVNGVNGIVVGTDKGVFATTTNHLGTWFRYGTALPDVQVRDMEYDATDDVLIVGTLGRGTWKMKEASTFLLPQVVLSTDTTTLPEDGSRSATVTARLSRANPDADVVVTLTSAGTATFTEPGGGAVYPEDYSRSLGTITIPAGQLVGTVTFTAIQDERDEFDETIQMTATVTEAELAVRTVDLTERRDYRDNPATGVPVANGSTLTRTITVTDPGYVQDLDLMLDIDHTRSADLRAVLTAPDGTSITLFSGIGSGASLTGTILDDEAVTPVSAADNPFTGRFIPQELLAAFDGHSVTGTWTLEIIDDVAAGSDAGTLLGWTLSIDRVMEAAIVPEITIIDDDLPPVVTLSVSPASGEMDETGGVSTITATLDKPSGKVVTVVLGVGGTAVDGTDYTHSGLTITILPEELTGTVTFTASPDAIVEFDETIIVDFVSLQNATDDGLQAQTITIIDDDAATISINDVVVVEGDSGTVDAIFTVTLNGQVDHDVTFDFDTAALTGSAADSDYVDLNGQFTFPANSGAVTTTTLTVTVNADAKVELDEMFELVLSNIQAGGLDVTFADDRGQGAITNDDSANLSIGDVTVAEGNAGATTFTFDVFLDAEVDTDVTIDFATADGTARASDSDYLMSSGLVSSGTALTFTGNSGGASTQQITVAVNGDAKVELDETFFVNLSNLLAGGRAVTLVDNQGLGTITNDDSANLSIGDVTVAEGNAGATTFMFDVFLDAEVDTDVTIDFTTADGTARTSDGDYLMSSGTGADVHWQQWWSINTADHRNR
ncbi:MAG: proprotein convertase P-domain-containing protein [Planctomycetaceae bacterium]